jgi:hypothetical protein
MYSNGCIRPINSEVKMYVYIKMVKKEKYYIIGLLLLICISLPFYNYKTIESLSTSTITEKNYTLIPNCNNNTTVQNLPSYKLNFLKVNFKCLFVSSNTNVNKNVESKIFNSGSIFGIDDCNDVLYSIAVNNVIKSYNIDNTIIKFKIQQLVKSDLITCLMQLMNDTNINYQIFGKTKQIKFTLNGNNYIINTNKEIGLLYSVDKLNDYGVKSITCNNLDITNGKYFYGKIFYDTDPLNFYYCICMSYY